MCTMYAKLFQLCPILTQLNPTDHMYGPYVQTIHMDSLSMEFFRQEYWRGLLFPSAGESSQPRERTCVSCVSCIGRWVLYHYCYLGSHFQIYWIVVKENIWMLKCTETSSMPYFIIPHAFWEESSVLMNGTEHGNTSIKVYLLCMWIRFSITG